MKTILITISVLFIINSNAQTTKDTNKIKDCDYKIYYQTNGNKEKEGCLVKGSKEGVWKEYTEKGWVRFEWNYINNEKNGNYKCFYEDGKIYAIGKYNNGSLSDTLTAFDPKGNIISKTVWKSIGYKKSQEIWRKIYVKNAKPDGTTETINGERYIWSKGEKLLLKK